MSLEDIKRRTIFDHLDNIKKTARRLELNPGDRYVVFSDLHIGNGGSRDDFLKNGDLFTQVLSDYYLSRNFSLILNGDIEELQRFRLNQITKRWADIYEVFKEFKTKGKLHKNFGNHDIELSLRPNPELEDCTGEAIELANGSGSIFIFHGHQASLFMRNFNPLAGLMLRYVANPLGIKGYSVSQHSLKKFRVEQRTYTYSSARKIVSLLGHTHRPLFESLSKGDNLRFQIERLCREYLTARHGEKNLIEKAIRHRKRDLEEWYEKSGPGSVGSTLYNSRLLVPCVFNSGCGIGKRGITAVEIGDGQIRLIHWFDRRRSQRFLQDAEYQSERLADSELYRVVLKSDLIDYIFTRIRLLA